MRLLNSSSKGEFKDVQDGISRPLGSREIQKTKVETVLPDTLYLLIGNTAGIGQDKTDISRFCPMHK